MARHFDPIQLWWKLQILLDCRKHIQCCKSEKPHLRECRANKLRALQNHPHHTTTHKKCTRHSVRQTYKLDTPVKANELRASKNMQWRKRKRSTNQQTLSFGPCTCVCVCVFVGVFMFDKRMSKYFADKVRRKKPEDFLCYFKTTSYSFLLNIYNCGWSYQCQNAQHSILFEGRV